MARPSSRIDISTRAAFGFDTFSGFHRVALFVDRLEPAAVERDILRIFAAEHRVGLRSRRHQDRLGGRHSHPHRPQPDLSAAPRRGHSIHFHLFRRQAFGEAHAFFERLGDFFVIQRVAGRVDQAPR
jgi:hypothetical protein